MNIKEEQVITDRKLNDDQWAELETQLRHAFETNLASMKACLTSPPKSKDPSKPPFLQLTMVCFDMDEMVPVAIYEYEMLGTREEMMRLLDLRHKALVQSPEYRKSQNKTFAILKDKFGVKDRDILDRLIPDATQDERDKVYNRLKRSYARLKAARKGTKS